jgi:hypothetical protein
MRAKRTHAKFILPVLATALLGGQALAQPVRTDFGFCNGGATDCTTALGHDSVSVASTLTINEMRAVSFGNVSVTCGMNCDGSAALALGLDGSRNASTTGGDSFILLSGVGGAGAQSPGHYTVEGQNEGGATQVYVSFADNGFNPVDISGDNYHPGASATLMGPGGQTFTMDKFVINESGNDIYGHYIDNRGGGSTPAPGTSNPFNHARAHDSSAVDVVVGATLHTVSGVASYPPGKYTGTFQIMVSY